MRLGKLTGEELKANVLDIIKHRRSEVVSGAAMGEDCASFKSDSLIVISTDPITGAKENIGSLAIQVATNDVYASGGDPFLAMLTIIAPPCASVEEIRVIMEDAEREAEVHNLEIAGGHTEFSDAVNRFVLSVVVLGKAQSHIKATAIRDGDTILVTKSVGIEGSVILANLHSQELMLSPNETEEIKSYSSLLSIAKESNVARKMKVSSMHDITEGGIFGAVAEICEGAKIGAVIRISSIPVTKLTKKICQKLNISPYGLISSGSLLITTNKPQEVVDELKKENISATIIGTIRGKKALGVYDNNTTIELFAQADELFSVKE